MVFFASLPVLVVTQYGANPHVLGWLFGALGGGALVGALVALRIVRRVEPLALTRGGVPLPDGVDVGRRRAGAVAASPLVGDRAAPGFFMSLVNAPMQAFVMLRIPRDLRTQALALLGSPQLRRRAASGS